MACALPLLFAAMLAEPALAQGAAATQASPIAAVSVALTRSGNDLLREGKVEDAARSYEAALASDPRNTSAYIGLGRAKQRMGLSGAALRHYRQALVIEPNNINALEAQGSLMADRGRMKRAQAAYERLRRLCGDCAQASRLDARIKKAAELAATKAKTPAPKPAPKAN